MTRALHRLNRLEERPIVVHGHLQGRFDCAKLERPNL